MITLSILLLTLTILIVITVIAVSVGGAAFVIVFGDVIVCIFIMVWLIKKIIRSKKK